VFVDFTAGGWIFARFSSRNKVEIQARTHSYDDLDHKMVRNNINLILHHQFVNNWVHNILLAASTVFAAPFSNVNFIFHRPHIYLQHDQVVQAAHFAFHHEHA
jgi:hypothetical protein